MNANFFNEHDCSCLRLKKQVESVASCGRDTVSQAISESVIRDGVKHICVVPPEV